VALPVLPPPYTLVLVDRERDPLAHARAHAARAVEDGLLVLADRTDRLALALLLEPDRPRAATLETLYVLANAAADTLAAHLPPLLPVGLGWPGRLLVDGAEVGRLRLAVADGVTEAPPAWLVLGLELRLAAGPEEPGRDPGRAALEEIAGDVPGSVELAESLSRHFLSWLERLEQEGPGPLRAAWNARCHERGRATRLTLDGHEASGTLVGLDGTGALRLGGHRLPLEAALGALA
jgi:biotin-(acetyl-CoA carboxylase) ligase